METVDSTGATPERRLGTTTSGSLSPTERDAAFVRRLAEAEALRRLSQALQRAGGLAEVYEAALDGVTTTLGATRASILLFDDDGVMRFRAWRGLSPEYRAAVEGHTPWRRDEPDPKPVLVPDVNADPALAPYASLFRSEGIGALAFVPLAAEGRLIGKLMVYHDAAHAFSEDEVRMATTMAAYVAFAVDREARDEKLRASEERLRVITDAVPMLIAHVDDGLVYRFVNQPDDAGWYGVPRSRVLGRTMPEVLGPDAWGAYEPYVRRALAGESVSFEEEVPYPRQGRRWVHGLLVPDRGADGLVRGLYAAVTDVTREKAAQERERELARLHEEDRFKTRLFNTAAHELNTPLTPVLMQIEMLKTPQMGPLTDRQARALALLERNLKRLEGLVQEMLDVARLHSGRRSEIWDPVALDALLAEIVESYRPAAQRHEVALDLAAPPPLTVAGDERRLAQVVGNLLSNALKFTPPGGRVRVAAERRADRVVVRVSDTGIGIDPREIGRLFQPFVQLQEPPRGAASGRGTGLGLYISRLIAEAHGGSLLATSGGADQGATFTVTLPLRRADGTRAASAAPTTNGSAGPEPAAPLRALERT